MNNSSKIILDLCGGTGSWSKPYKDGGYDVRIITLPDKDVFTYEPPKHVYGVLAAPTCTMFSFARTTAKTPRNLHEGMALVNRCFTIIQKCMHGGAKFWALENPKGFLRHFFGKPPLTFHPNEFGDPYTKATDLWGFYNFPKQKIVMLNLRQRKQSHLNSRELPPLPKNYVLPEGWNKRAAQRSVTPEGFANAFFRANP